MSSPKTVIIVPQNDAEGILIGKIAEKMGLSVILSNQTHGASLDKGRDYIKLIKKDAYKRVIVVEMPGVKAEKKLRKLGIELVLIDHHHYTGLNRAHDEKTGKMLLSSLEQFIRLMRLSDSKLSKLGFDPLLVRGIGIHDKGFIWALKKEGYSKQDIKRVLAYHDELVSLIHNPKTEVRKQAAVAQIWKRRKKWNGFYVVETKADIQLRPRLSRLIAVENDRPTPLIILERSRGLIYVQESNKAMDLFNTFGGFTFGMDRNWGYRNVSGHHKVTLKDVKKVLMS